MQELAKVVGDNLAKLRKKKGLTQGQIAEKFHYTDNSISKWEHGESLPDLAIVKELAFFYGVTIDYLTEKHEEVKADIKTPISELINKQLVIALSVLFVWSVAAVIYLSFLIKKITVWDSWLAFIWAIPLTAIVLAIFDSIWNRHRLSLPLSLAIAWSLIIATYIEIACDMLEGGWRFWFILLCGIPLTIALVIANKVIKK